MAKFLTADNATSTLAVGISSGATSVTVQAGAGALFPQPNTSTGTKFYATFVSAANSNVKEVILCTARTTDTMTITPTNQSWNSGDTFMLSDAAELLQQLVQFDDLQAQAGNYAFDTGSANVYSVTLTPALSAHVDGMPIRFRAGHANTGASTFNDGVGAVELVLPGGTALPSGIIVADVIYTTFWNAEEEYFQLQGALFSNFAQLGGQVANNQVPQSAVLQFLSAILSNAALTGTPTAPTPTQGTFNAQVATTAFVQVAAAAAAAAAANPGSSIGPTGYKAYIDGLIEQWGSFTTNGSNVTINFPQQFPHACFNVFLQGGANAGAYAGQLAAPPSTSGFVCNTADLTSGVTVYWTARGN